VELYCRLRPCDHELGVLNHLQQQMTLSV
jgi:hypothetical protein